VSGTATAQRGIAAGAAAYSHGCLYLSGAGALRLLQ
jgi:hypothetical protein